jgi:hypothetical protein
MTEVVVHEMSRDLAAKAPGTLGDNAEYAKSSQFVEI